MKRKSKKDIRLEKGIYKTYNHKYKATKRINNKKHEKTFDLLEDARLWRKVFDGTNEEKIQSFINISSRPPLKTVWEIMQRDHFPTLAPSTQNIWRRRYNLLEEIEHVPIDKLTSPVITSWVQRQVKYFKGDEYQNNCRGNARRCNLDNELNLLVTIWNWAKESEQFENIIGTLPCPVHKKHRKLGKIKDLPKKHQNITIEELKLFLSYLTPIYRDLASYQFLIAGRISEAVGQQWSTIDLTNKTLDIVQTAQFHPRNKTFIGLNPRPKNRDIRPVYINDEIEAILKRREAFKISGCDFVFHIDGKPLNYGTIQAHYRKAQRNVGLKCTGTHVLRPGMAKLVRKIGGGLDAVMAMTRHKDVKLADHYSSCNEDDQKEFSQKIMEHIREVRDKDTKENVVSFSNVVSLSSYKSGTYNEIRSGKVGICISRPKRLQ